MNGTPRSARASRRWKAAGQALVVVALLAGAASAWRPWSIRNAYGAATDRSRTPESAESVRSELDSVGLSCRTPLVFSPSKGEGGAGASCTDGPDYDIKVAATATAVTGLLDLARGVGCMGAVGRPSPSQWFTVHRNNWVLFTLEADVARSAMQLRGTVVSTALCPRQRSGPAV